MLSLNDQVKIIKVSLSGEDYFVLSQMYLPLVGMDSFSVYVALNNINCKDNATTVTRLLDLFNLTNVGVLENSLNKLEGIGLVKRYISNIKNQSEEITLIELYRPIDSESFLKNPLLSKYLEFAIGPVEYKVLYNSVTKVNKPGYKEVTKSFDEVFKTGDKKESLFNEDLKREIKDNIRVKNDKFDYLYFKLMFNKDIIDAGVLDSDIFEQSILRVSYQYGLNEEEMYEAVYKAFTLYKNVDIEVIAKNASYIYQNKKKAVTKEVKPVIFEVKEAVEYNGELSDSEKKYIHFLENNKIEQVLAKCSGGKASVAEIKSFTKLAEDNSLPESVINYLIVLTVNNKDGEIPGYNYLEKIAKTWIRAGVKSVEDAIKYVNRSVEAKTTPKRANKKTKSNPDWVKEYTENIKEKGDKKLTEEEINAGINAGNDLFG